MIGLNAAGRFVGLSEIEHLLLFLVVGGFHRLTNAIGIVMIDHHEPSDTMTGVYLHVLSDLCRSAGVISTTVIIFLHDVKIGETSRPSVFTSHRIDAGT
jgi:Co/Zn/Cd efflux system component